MTSLISFIVLNLETTQEIITSLKCSNYFSHKKINMMKLLLIAALCGVAYAGHLHGHGGGYGGGIGGIGGGGIGGGGIGGGGGGGYGGGHGGWGWHQPRIYHGWANVNAWQTPHAYQYGLQEQGKGYQKYIWQGAEFKGWGHGGGYAG